MKNQIITMKNFFFAFLFITSTVQAQQKIVGTLSPSEKQSTALLYRIVGAKQIYINNTNIENGSFVFNLKNDEKVGVYRVAYDTKENSFVDFFYNKEDIIFQFDPKNAEDTKTFSISEENKLYSKFIQAVSYIQFEIDSLQVNYLKNPDIKTAERYKTALGSINNVQKKYTEESQGKIVHEFIKATDRYNAPEIAKTPNEYLSGIKTHFFDNINFDNKIVFNSPFFVDRISDYVFYINYSDDQKVQNVLYKESTEKIIGKIDNPEFKKDVIEYLITQFMNLKNVDLVDFLFENQYNSLPYNSQNLDFKKEVLASLTVEVGRTAPDFSWKENGKTIKLSQLKDGENYILVFYSTTCSHCTVEIPKLYEFLKDKPTTKVIAFAMEEDDSLWNDFKSDLNGWHHILGLNKWKNETSKMYNIYSTPTYFMLNEDKKIIAKPNHIEDLVALFK